MIVVFLGLKGGVQGKGRQRMDGRTRIFVF